MAKVYHPDSEAKDASQANFVKLQEAYELLKKEIEMPSGSNY